MSSAARKRKAKKEEPSMMQKVGDAVSQAAEKAGATLAGVKEKAQAAFHDTKESVKESVSSKESKEVPLPTGNRGVVYNGPGKIEIKSVPYPKMELPWNGQPVVTGAILKVLTAGICGSDLHPYRGRTAMAPGTVIGHEFCGEIVEVGPGVQTMKVGDWGAVPFNVSCGTCPSCKELRPETCDWSNPEKRLVGQGGLFGYVCGGGWQGGQAEYVFVPWIDYNFLKFENKTLAKQKLLDLTLLTDVLPTAFHGTCEAQVEFGKTVYIAGAGPIGLAAAAICHLKGAARVIISDFILERLELALRLGCLTIDLNHVSDEKQLAERVKELNGSEFTDCGIECVGYEARDFSSKKNVCAAALNGVIEVTKPAGHIGVLGAFFVGDPKAPSASEKAGFYNLPFGKAWMKGQKIQGGQASCMRYMRKLQQMIMCDKLPIAKILDVRVIPLDDVPNAFSRFDDSSPHKFIIDPHNVLNMKKGSTSGSSTTTTSGSTASTESTAAF